jgi:hypothetical protein
MKDPFPYISCPAFSHEGANYRIGSAHVGGGTMRTTAGRARTGVGRALTFVKGGARGWGGRACLRG